MLGYNRMTGYNKARYNAEGTEMAAADTMTMVDSTVTKQILKTLTDLITTAETIAKQQNKSVNEVLKIDAWLSIDREDASKWQD